MTLPPAYLELQAYVAWLDADLRTLPPGPLPAYVGKVLAQYVGHEDRVIAGGYPSLMADWPALRARIADIWCTS